MRRFGEDTELKVTEGVKIPKVIVIDEYKGDTDAGNFQWIVADGVTKKSIYIGEYT